MTQHVQAAFDLRAGPSEATEIHSTAVVFGRDGDRMDMSRRATTTVVRPPMSQILPHPTPHR